MSSYIITIDGGTTNTRCVLWDEARHKVSERQRDVGVRNTAIDGNNSRLKAAVRDCLEELLAGSGLTYGDIRLIIASGMITSDVGIVEIPHLTAPADLVRIAESTAAVTLPDICPLPIHFIPGIKNSPGEITLDNYEAMDIMRGEEVESLAIIHQCHTGSPMILVLPGSHNKFVAVDADRKITGCLTSISGELLSVITNNTILAKSVQHNFVSPGTYDREWLLLGYNNAKKTGLGRACFSARILNLFRERDPLKIANYILGASLQGDITAVRNSSAVRITPDTKIVICGKNPLQEALLDIFTEEQLCREVSVFQPQKDFSASALGAYLVAEQCRLL